MNIIFSRLIVMALLGCSATAVAQSPYSASRGQNIITETAEEPVVLEDGTVEVQKVQRL